MIGSWITTDRALVIKDETRHRIFWTDETGTVRADDGTYRIVEDDRGGVTILFSSGNQTFPWELQDLDEKSLVIVHDEAGPRKFQPVPRQDENPSMGNWDVTYTRSDGRRGTARMYL